MTHQISPTLYRLGKTRLWTSNNLGITKQSPSIQVSSTFTELNLTNLIKHKIRRRRMFVVRCSFVTKSISRTMQISLLFMPRMKQKPKPDSRGSFSKMILYKNHLMSPLWLGKTKRYVDERRLKNHRFPLIKDKKINRWITRRMFRGSSPAFNSTKQFQVVRQQAFYNEGRLVGKYKRRFKLIKWWNSRSKLHSLFSAHKLSHKISSIVGLKVMIVALNVFKFMAQKQLIGFRSHQEHFWHKNYRHYRFSYDNYYDIVNSIFILSLLRNSEMLLLEILRIMMPRIRKIKRFMYFIDSVIKNMIQVRHNFSCCRITLSGKIRGGTQRTKTLSVGFGLLPYQSINLEGKIAFVRYRHKFGEFGLGLLINRTILSNLPIIHAR